ncbi:MAG: PEP-utilizing enzyme [Myxococcales bacterium]
MISGLYGQPASELAAHALRYGQKAAWLSRALGYACAIPQGVAVSGDEVRAALSGEPAVRAALEAALADLRAEGAMGLAVRSSPADSLPGALLTRLGVASDLEAVLQGITEVLASDAKPAARAQRAARGIAEESPALPILVQRYVEVEGPADFGAVVFTRDPDRGTAGLVGEYLPGLGAEQVVSGKRVPWPLATSARAQQAQRESSLSVRDPAAYAEIEALAARLEHGFGEPLELEFVRAQGVLWLLQVRPLVMSARALVHVTLEAIEADSPAFRRHAERLLSADLTGLIEREFPAPVPDAQGDSAPQLRGLVASRGVASGVLVTDPERALARAPHEPVILFRNQASPEDVAAFRAASAVVTTSGGLTCHAAVIARGLAVPAVVGCSDVLVDSRAGLVHRRHDPSAVVLREGDLVSVDAQRGLVYRGAHQVLPRVVSPELRRLAQELRKLREIALWAYGPPDAALQAKEDAWLDGIVCPVTSPEGIPAARGRECWLEVPGAELLAWLPRLPAGWGVVVRGGLPELPLSELRRMARLRPLGLWLDAGIEGTHAGVDVEAARHGAPRFDLAVLGPGVGPSEELSGLAPRLLSRADSASDSARLSHPAIGGVLCETGRASEWILRLALRLRAPTSAH